MRADRLVAILLLLQQRGQVTAPRSRPSLRCPSAPRRDLEALGTAGVPIYSRAGRNGGWQLVGGARTDLSGLNAAEARALFLVAGPSSAATPEVKAALRKLVRALPEPFRPEAEAASTAVVVDASGWDRETHTRPAPHHLDALQQAVVRGEQVELDYVARDRVASRRVVHPLGLATKGHAWYLVADTEAGLRTFRVDRVTGVEPTATWSRPDGFDLAESWRLVSDEVDQPGRRCSGTAAPDSVSMLRGIPAAVSASARPVPTVAPKWRSPLLRAGGELAGFGVLLAREPPELRNWPRSAPS